MKKLELDLKGTTKKIAKIKRIYKLLFSIGFNISIFVLLYFLVIIPQLETKTKLEEEYGKFKKELNNMIAIKNNMQKFRQEYGQLQELLQQMLKQLPETKDIPNLLRNASNVGSESRLKITYFEPRTLQSKEFYAELPFVIRYSGPFHHIGYFFDGVRKLERIINITSFTLTSTSDAKATTSLTTLTGECMAKTYVYLKEQPKPQEKKEEKKDEKGGTPAKK